MFERIAQLSNIKYKMILSNILKSKNIISYVIYDSIYIFVETKEENELLFSWITSYELSLLYYAKLTCADMHQFITVKEERHLRYLNCRAR